MTTELTRMVSTFSPEMLDAFLSVTDNYRFHVRAFVKFARGRTGSVLDVVRDFYRELNASGLSASTIRCRRQALKKRLMQAAETWGDRQRNAFEYELKHIDSEPGLKCPSCNTRAVGANRVINEEEYEKLMKNARSARQRRFMEFLYATGARISELTGAKLTDCRIEGNVVSVRLMGKGNKKAAYKERTVYITAAMYERIRATFGGTTYLFETGCGKRYNRCYVSNQLGKLTLAVLGRRLGAHSFRHSFATRTIKQTGRIRAVSQYLGHSDIGITLRIYDHDTFSPTDVLGAEACA